MIRHWRSSQAAEKVCGSRLDLTAIRGLNHTLRVEAGVLAVEAAELLRGFFRSLRAASGREDSPSE